MYILQAGTLPSHTAGWVHSPTMLYLVVTHLVIESQPLTSDLIESKAKEEECVREMAFRNIGIKWSRNTST